MVLLDKSGILTRDDDKTNVRFAFDVPAGTQALQIEFAYSPKTLTDPELEKQICETALKKYNGAVCYDEYKQYLPLKNLVTLSLDDPAGYRGAAHRQDHRQIHTVGAAQSSYGFTNAPTQPGTWYLTLNVHCALCRIDYTVKISTKTETEVRA